MRDETMLPEPAPDPQLRAALRDAEAEPPLQDVDWSGLRSSISAAAALPLARRRHALLGGRTGAAVRPARPATRWLRSLAPLAAAASIAVAVWAGSGRPGLTPAPAPVAEASASVEDVFRPDLSEQEYRQVISGRDNADALLLIAIDER